MHVVENWIIVKQPIKLFRLLFGWKISILYLVLKKVIKCKNAQQLIIYLSSSIWHWGISYVCAAEWMYLFSLFTITLEYEIPHVLHTTQTHRSPVKVPTTEWLSGKVWRQLTMQQQNVQYMHMWMFQFVNKNNKIISGKKKREKKNNWGGRCSLLSSVWEVIRI